MDIRTHDVVNVNSINFFRYCVNVCVSAHILQKAEKFFKEKMPDSKSGQKTALKAVKNYIQALLDNGETQDFKPLTCGQNITRRVHIAVMVCAALRACPFSNEPDLER
jgi:hypothetical protein